MYLENETGNLITKDFITSEKFLLASYNPEKECEVNIKSLKKSIVLQAKYSEIKKLYTKRPDLENMARSGAEDRLEKLYKHMESITSIDALRRYQLFQIKFGDYEKEIPQYLIASYLGITPTQLSRIKKKLKKI